MENEAHKYCVSSVAMVVAKFGTDICIRSWNEHCIQGMNFLKPSFIFKPILNKSFEINSLNFQGVENLRY